MLRLDRYLVEHELVRSRTLAAKLIGEGAVLINGKPQTKASYKVGEFELVEVVASELTAYVSRAGHKLAGALDAFPQIRVEGKTCLDAGASTGGFTDVLLKRGAASVAAVDVGHDQLVDELRADTRVQVYEGMNVRYMKPEDIGGRKEVIVSDLSFISLTLVMESLARAAAPGADLVLMVKPQFEVGPHKIGRGGVVTDPAAHREAVEKVETAARAQGLEVRGVQQSPLPGQDGNLEFFLWCSA